MLVTRILGDCPGCRGRNHFGNVSVLGDHVLRGCMSCKYSTKVWLPEIRKKIIYLDQFFFSSAFRGREERLLNAARRIRQLSDLQLLVIPFSSIHEDETHQWRGFGGKNKEELMEFIKATSGGHQFEPAYEVERNQVTKAFQVFLTGSSAEFELKEHDAIKGNIHEWEDYFRIDVGFYFKDIERIRSLKRQAVENLVSIFERWRQTTDTFEQHVALEMSEAGKNYIDSYLEFVGRIARGDHTALFNAPIMSLVVESMLHCLPRETLPEKGLEQVRRFFASEHFAQVPYQWLSARIYAKLQDMIQSGAYTNREEALKRLSGFLYDVGHIATYAPYCDAFVMDQSMAGLVNDQRVKLEERYAVKVFSLNNWDELFAWLDALETGMTIEHKAGLSEAYP